MKRFLTTIFLSVGLLFPCKADFQKPLVISMNRVEINNEPGEPSEDYTIPNKHRGQSKQLECVITQDGLTIPGYDVEDILSYEVFTVDGDPVAVFTEEEDFISFIFTATGAYEIRLQFEEITLTGFISL